MKRQKQSDRIKNAMKEIGYTDDVEFWSHMKEVFTYREILKRFHISTTNTHKAYIKHGLIKEPEEKNKKKEIEQKFDYDFDITKRRCLKCLKPLTTNDIPIDFTGDLRGIWKCSKCRGDYELYESGMFGKNENYMHEYERSIA